MQEDEKLLCSFDPHIKDSVKVLIIEDDENVADLLAEGVSCAEGEYEVYTAKDGIEAAEKISELQPDIIILDIILPGIDGFKLCRMIKNQRKAAKVIAITGNDALKIENEIRAAGADAYLVKPFNVKHLITMIKDFADKLGWEKNN